MSVPVQDPINQIIIAGGETLIPWTWNLQKADEITVLVQRAATGLIDTLTLDSDYTVDTNGLDNDSGGNITPIGSESPVTTDDIWTLLRDTAIARSQDFATGGAFLAKTINEQLDNPIRITQEQKRDIGTAVRKDPGVGDTLNPLIPQPVDERALKFRDSGGGNFDLVMSDGDPDQQTNDAAASAAAALASEQAAAISETGAETAETNAGNSETAAGVSEANAATSETNAANSETAAGISETNAANSATAASDQLEGTSTTSLAIATGVKVFITQADKFFEAGVSLKITSDADPTNLMFGDVTSYSGTTLTMNITVIGGPGTFSDWTIRLSGVEGPAPDLSSPDPIGDVTPNTIKATSIEAPISINGSINFDLSTATGTTNIVVTGLGLKPKHIILMMASTDLAVVFSMMGTVTRSVVVHGNSTGTYRELQNPVYQLSIGNLQSFSLQSLDSDGFTLGNTKTGSPAGSIVIAFMAFV